jgi:hypothetical protein
MRLWTVMTATVGLFAVVFAFPAFAQGSGGCAAQLAQMETVRDELDRSGGLSASAVQEMNRAIAKSVAQCLLSPPIGNAKAAFVSTSVPQGQMPAEPPSTAQTVAPRSTKLAPSPMQNLVTSATVSENEQPNDAEKTFCSIRPEECSPATSQLRKQVLGDANARAEATGGEGAIPSADQQDAAQSEFCRLRPDACTPTGSLPSFYSNFTIGVATLFLPRSNIESAEVVGGNVIVTREQRHRVTPWLQANYFWDGWAARKGFTHTAPGIFVGVGGGANGDFLNTVAIGGMLGFKRKRLGDPTDKASLNLGVGYYWSTIRRLANGIEEGMPLPDGVESPLLVDRTVNGPMLNVSFGF